MKYLLFIFSFLTMTASASAERVFYVSPSGSGEQVGLDWNTPTSLDAATTRAIAGDQIWVLEGTYFTSSNGDRTATIALAAGVSLLGGFHGNEASPLERTNGARSILSGDIGVAGSSDDNAYTVITLLAGSANSIVDGFVITNGSARNFTRGFTPGNAGGGMYIVTDGDILPAHSISNCDFTENKGHNGAGIFVSGGSTSFDNCTFSHNVADFMGGAIYNQGTGSEVTTRFIACQFDANGADYGGAMANNGENGTATPLAIQCTFSNNAARTNGATAYNMTNEFGISELITEACGFTNNNSILGDNIATKGDKRSMSQLASDSKNAPVIITGAAKR